MNGNNRYEFDEKQFLIQCIVRKLEGASLIKVRQIFYFINGNIR